MFYSIGDIVVRKPALADASDALEMLLDPDVVRWNPESSVVDLPSAVEWCRRGADWQSGAHATFHVIDTVSGRLLANVSIHAVEISSQSARIGYRVAPWARGQGIGRVTVDAVARWSFARLPLRKIVLIHDVSNDKSCKLALAAGFGYEGLAWSRTSDQYGDHEIEHVHERLSTDYVLPLDVVPIFA